MFIRTSSSLMQGTNFIDGQNNLHENVVHLSRSMFIDQSDWECDSFYHFGKINENLKGIVPLLRVISKLKQPCDLLGF